MPRWCCRAAHLTRPRLTRRTPARRTCTRRFRPTARKAVAAGARTRQEARARGKVRAGGGMMLTREKVRAFGALVILAGGWACSGGGKKTDPPPPATPPEVSALLTVPSRDLGR